jgi:A/G-specific adenine glycosylase
MVAELLLQRTRASQVEPVFNLFRERYPTAEALVQAGPAAATAMTQRLGLHLRGRMLYALALFLVEHGGLPPEDLASLRRVPGVGIYTAAAWLSLHRGKRAVIVDSNVARWLARLTGRSYPRDPRHVRWIRELAEQLTPKRAFRDYNYAILDFTMQICTSRAPRCTECPLRMDCAYGRWLT